MITLTKRNDSLSRNLGRSLLKSTAVNFGLQALGGNLRKDNIWQTLLVGVAGGFGDYFGGNTAMGAILGGGNAIINKSHFVGTTAKYALCGAAADVVLRATEAKAEKPWQDEPIPITDEFLKAAQKAWFPDFPMEYVKAFTVENVSANMKARLDANMVAAATSPLTVLTVPNSKLSDYDKLQAYAKNNSIELKFCTGNSCVYFNRDLAFTSAKQLFYTMGHELVHVSQNIACKNEMYLEKISNFVTLKEYFAYSFQKYVLGDENNIRLNSFTPEVMRKCMSEFDEFVPKLNYQGLSWIDSIKYVYPF